MALGIKDPAVARAFDAFPQAVRADLLALRALIFEVAAETPEAGPIEETLKWGQPAYLTQKTKSGTTIRLGAPKAGGFAIYTHCQTSLIADFRALFAAEFSYEGNRAICFAAGETVDRDKIALLIRRALTYHQRLIK